MSKPETGLPVILLVGTSSYLPYVRVLTDSLRCFHPDWPVFFCRMDTSAVEFPGEIFQGLEASWLEGKTGTLTKFQYTPVEICGMSRPRAMLELFRRGYSRIVYLDLDVSIHASLDPLIVALEQHAMVLTPHLLEPSTKTNPEKEENNYRLTGIVNSGCMALRDHAQTRLFLEWWKARTERHGHLDKADGLFNEQSWVDYACSFYEEAFLFRDAGFNVAFWNLTERHLALLPDGSYTAGGRPLVLFHWSGYHPGNPAVLSSHLPGSHIPSGSVLETLSAAYGNQLLQHGAGEKTKIPYPYAYLSDGTPIKETWREAVRQRHPGLSIPDDPFHPDPEWISQLQALERSMQFSRKDWIIRNARQERNKAKGLLGKMKAAWRLFFHP